MSFKITLLSMYKYKYKSNLFPRHSSGFTRIHDITKIRYKYIGNYRNSNA